MGTELEQFAVLSQFGSLQHCKKKKSIYLSIYLSIYIYILELSND